MSSLDRFISEFDRGLRTLAGVHAARRPSPAEAQPDMDLPQPEREDAAALMRVNHAGEVCAQALYQGQALAAQDPSITAALEDAAREEEDHLAWTASRIRELGGRPSVLNPVWYAGSLAMGYAAGKFGDRWNLGFLKETERQVEAHLQSHLDRLNPADTRTRTVVERMQEDERGHADTAAQLGAVELPFPAKLLMKLTAKVMTSVSYRL